MKTVLKLGVAGALGVIATATLAQDKPALTYIKTTSAGQCQTGSPVTIENRSTASVIIATVRTKATTLDSPYCKSSSHTKDHRLSPGASKFIGCEGTHFEPGGAACARTYKFDVVGARY